MKLSSLTLQNLKDEIPLQLTGRYSIEAFPVSKFNEISSHLEKYADTPYMSDWMIIPKEDGITTYKLDDLVRQPKGVYELYSGYTMPDKTNPIRFTQNKNDIRLSVTPSVSEGTHTDARNINDSTGSTLKKLYDTGGASPLEVDENLSGKGIIITHASGAVDHRIIASNDDDDGWIRVDGEMSEIPDDDTIYSIYNDFWILEYARYLPRLTALTDPIAIPQDFEYVYRWGMFWYYYAQEGENKAEIDRYGRLFEKEKSRFCSDQNRTRSDNFMTKPRVVPSMFPSRGI